MRSLVLIAAIVLFGACSSDSGSASTSSQSAGSAAPADAAAIKTALASEFANVNAPPAEIDCVGQRVTEQLTGDQLAAMGVTKAGLDLPTLGPKSVQLEPTTVTFWDTIFECIPELADIGTVASGFDAPTQACVQHSIIDDKRLRLALVLGTPNGQQTPPELTDLETKVEAALKTCGIGPGAAN